MQMNMGRGTRALLAGTLLALAGLSLPARAAGEPAPALKASSIDSGWSRLDRLVSFEFANPGNMQDPMPIDRARSSAELRDRDGTVLSGALNRDERNAAILFFTPDDRLRTDRAPYTVVLTARALGQDAAVPDTVITKTFRVDTQVPVTPELKQPSSPAVLPGEVLTLEGAASDRGASGIASVQFRFYNPASGRINEVRDYRVEVASECSEGFCPNKVTVSATPDLPAGYWTVKLAAVDLAGNISAESSPVSVLVLKA